MYVIKTKSGVEYHLTLEDISIRVEEDLIIFYKTDTSHIPKSDSPIILMIPKKDLEAIKNMNFIKNQTVVYTEYGAEVFDNYD